LDKRENLCFFKSMLRTLSVAAAMLLAAPAVCSAHVKGGPEAAHQAVSQHTVGRSAAAYSQAFLGDPYVYGGSTPSGFDCSGFTRYVYAHFGIDLAHSTYAQWDEGRHVARADLRPGDLVFFYGEGHVGIYLGDGKFIHAPHTGTVVSVDSLDGWYGADYDGAVRVYGAEAAFPRIRPVLYQPIKSLAWRQPTPAIPLP
jgi:cell wall-associated NlpC family hydrolase